ncbi:ribonuclease R [soil metagenome]
MARAIEKELLSLLREPEYRPMTKSELARHFDIPPKSRQEFRDILGNAVHSGKVVRLKRGRYALAGSPAAAASKANERSPSKEPRNRLTGRIQFRMDGNAFVVPVRAENEPAGAGRPRIFIPGRFTETALEGDLVAVRFEESGVPAWWKHDKTKQALIKNIAASSAEPKLEGRVLKVVERSHRRVTGTFHRRAGQLVVETDDINLPAIIRIPTDRSAGAKPGEIVTAAIDQWEVRSQPAEGHVLERLGKAGTPGVDILAIIHKNNLAFEFPPAALAEAEAVPETISEAEIARREDWRDQLVFTIDPFDAKDFDDAIAVRPLAGGGWELAVHIADVSHYVRPGTHMDAEALRRGNSTYLVDRVIPMLPEKLSNGICSLKPKVDRRTRCAVLTLDSKAHVRSARFTGAVINSKVRLTYEQAIEKMKADPAKAADNGITAKLHEAWALASKLRKNRFAKGALDLDFAETKVHLDEDGTPVKLVRVEYDESHQLIEEFMLTANEAVAKKLRDSSRPCIYRIHEDPDEAKLFEFRELLRAHGLKPGDLTHRTELQRVLQAIKGMPEEHALKVGLLKSLKRAAYSADSLGHFGLAKENYTHFTSPIRRYADLVVHRVLNRLTEPEHFPERTPSYTEMQEMGEHISNTERNSGEAEMQSVRLKEMEFLDILSRDPDSEPMDAAVTEVRPVGLFVEIIEFMIRGVVKREHLPQDEYFYDGALQALVGRSGGGQTFRAGSVLPVRVAHVDFEKMRADFMAVGAPTAQPKSRRPKTSKPPATHPSKQRAKPKKAAARSKKAAAGSKKPEPDKKRARRPRRRRRRTDGDGS